MVHLILPRWRYSAGSIWYAEFQGQVGHIPERDLSDMYVFARSLARSQCRPDGARAQRYGAEQVSNVDRRIRSLSITLTTRMVLLAYWWCSHSVSSSTLFAGVVVYNFVPEESHEGALTVFADEPIYVLDATGPWWYSVIADEDSEERVRRMVARCARARGRCWCCLLFDRSESRLIERTCERVANDGSLAVVLR